MRKNNYTVLFFILLGITTLIIYCTLTNGHNWGDDFSLYIMQAKSIIELNPRSIIEANSLMFENLSAYQPIAYPWGFPLLLVPFYAVFGLNMIGLKLLGAISYLLFLIVLWIGFQKYHLPFWLLCLVCLFSLNPTMISFTNQILPDLIFLLLSTVTVLLIGRLIVEEKNIISPIVDYIMLGIIMACSFFIRANGILLLLVLAITQFISLAHKLLKNDYSIIKSFKPIKNLLANGKTFYRDLLINLLPYISFLCIVLPWQAILPKGQEYYISMSNNISMDIIKIQFLYCIFMVNDFFDGVPYGFLFYVASILIAGTGMIKRYRSDYHIITYIILTFSLYVVWPWWPSNQGLRYLFPILPFYFSFAITGLETFQGGRTSLAQNFRKWCCIFPLLFIFVFFTINSASNAYANIIHHRSTTFGPYTKDSQDMFSFIRSNTGKESTIVFFKPWLMKMMTERKSVTKEGLSRGDFLCLYLSCQVKDRVAPEYIQNLVNEKRAFLVYKNNDFRVYKLTHSQVPCEQATKASSPTR